MNSVVEIQTTCIVPSPFQHRRVFDEGALRELARSIEQDGLIQPITVRHINGEIYELIAGERRWRAVKNFTALPTIPARVLIVDDLQARRLCATENLQRADLTSLEEVMALCELVDASLLEFSEDYAPLSPIQEPKWRVKTLLTKLESDRKHGTDYFGSKFTAKLAEIFAGLPKPKDPISFTTNDLPLLFTANEVQTFALEHRLNKAQTKAVDQLQKAAQLFLGKSVILLTDPARLQGRRKPWTYYRGQSLTGHRFHERRVSSMKLYFSPPVGHSGQRVPTQSRFAGHPVRALLFPDVVNGRVKSWRF